jgi:hypothetical protein
MSRDAIEEILARAIEDEQFRARLLQAPGDAVEGYDLTPEERRALLSGDLRSILLAVNAPDAAG